MISGDLLKDLTEDEVAGLATQFIRFRTVNPPGDEAPLARFVARVLAAAGIQTELQPLGDNRANALARVGVGRPALVLCGHLDVVPPGGQKWTRDPFGGEIAEGKVWGRGSSDMKGGLAAMVAAVRALARVPRDLPNDVVLVCTVGEETDKQGAQAACGHPWLADAVGLVIGEPTGLKIATEQRGALWVEVTAIGKAAHGSMPETGINAAVRLLRFLGDALNLPTGIADPVLGQPTLTLGTLNAGVAPNVVPDRASATLDLRTVRAQDHVRFLESLRVLIERHACDDPTFRAEIRILRDLPPVQTPRDAPLVRRAIRATAGILGTESPVFSVPYMTDAATMQPLLNVPVVVLGPGEIELAHQTDEWIAVDRLVAAAQIYTVMALST